MSSDTIDQLHRQAIAHGEDTYIDPQSGAMVFTAVALGRRARCCGSRCRHCPYDHINVPSAPGATQTDRSPNLPR